MAGGRRYGGRHAARTQVHTHNNSVSSSNNYHNSAASHADVKKNQISVGRTLAPKHVPIPAIPVDGQLLFEAVSLGTSLVGTSMQLLNLYRTVWWLPQSYNQYTMNFYLIDRYLIVFIFTMIIRQFIYALLCKLMDIVTPSRWLPLVQRITRIILLIIIMGIISWCLYNMSEKHNIIKVFFFCYPSMSIYFLMFGTNIGPFFDISTATLYIKEDRKTKFLLDKPLHNCSLNASAIRAEVASLKSDFNSRLKRALYASTGSAYICGVAPVIFVPQHLHFDVFWVVQHIVLIWFGRLGTHFTRAYPVRYCDVLHRAALHLGKWSKVESKNNHTSVQSWNDSVLWPNGSVVRYNKEIYRSEGLCTAAVPGNSSHYRFYALFGNPIVLQSLLLGLELSFIAVQLMILIRTTEWYKILSISLLNITNYYTLYRFTRDYLVCSRVYRAEQIVQEKAQKTLSNNS